MTQQYQNDIFYSVFDLPFKTKVRILKDCYKLAYEWKVNYLDCAKSISRQWINMSFKEIMKKFDNTCYFVFIFRRGFSTEGYKGETGFRTMETGIDYFLFINISVENLLKIIGKYKLRQM